MRVPSGLHSLPARFHVTLPNGKPECRMPSDLMGAAVQWLLDNRYDPSVSRGYSPSRLVLTFFSSSRCLARSGTFFFLAGRVFLVIHDDF